MQKIFQPLIEFFEWILLRFHSAGLELGACRSSR